MGSAASLSRSSPQHPDRAHRLALHHNGPRGGRGNGPPRHPRGPLWPETNAPPRGPHGYRWLRHVLIRRHPRGNPPGVRDTGVVRGLLLLDVERTPCGRKHSGDEKRCLRYQFLRRGNRYGRWKPGWLVCRPGHPARRVTPGGVPAPVAGAGSPGHTFPPHDRRVTAEERAVLGTAYLVASAILSGYSQVPGGQRSDRVWGRYSDPPPLRMVPPSV